MTAPAPSPLFTRDPLPEPLNTEMRTLLAASAAAADRSGLPDLDAVDALRRTGLLGLSVPYEYGGAGAGPVELNRCVAQIASVNASAAIILFQHYAVSSRIVEQGTPEQHAELLPRLASGEWLAASAWSETGAGADKKRLSTTGHRTEDGGWVLDGAKSFTTSAGLAGIYLVLVRTGEASALEAGEPGYGAAGQTFFLVRGDNPGLFPDTSLPLVGMRGSATGFVSLRNCQVADTDRLGPAGAAASIIAKVRESGATLGAVALGVAQAALECAHEHATAHDLLEHQAVRHRLVDLATEVESARAMVERAGRKDSADPGTTTLHSKLCATAVAERVITGAEQILGSAGYAEAHPVNRYRRDARAVALMGPTNDLCRELVGTPWTQ
ncbi:acyl-CoA dehydrogenase family protein [Streptomyces sp. NPDC086554]|uniref:acyl-CoA dehydrogenase family protein n=1 Tax=Streptomyces sp. NPDC086554 TaxID=3154864 RepID=UPI0034169A3B